MRLTVNDREILASAYFQADAPLATIATETGIAQHTVRRSLENLLESGYIRRYAYINPSRLGFTEYYISWRPAARESEFNANILRQLALRDGVSWLAEIGGPFPYETVLFARDARHATELFASLTHELGPIMMDKKVATLLSFTSFVPKFLSTRPYALKSIGYHTDHPPVRIDELDHNILRNLTAATFTSYGQVARALGVGQSTLTYRIDRLKKEGIILGEGYLIKRSDLVGMSSFRVLATLTRHGAEVSNQLLKLCESHDSIYCLAELLGDYDIELSARVHHPREIPAMIESLRSALPDTFGVIEFYPDIQNFKSSSYPFLSRPE